MHPRRLPRADAQHSFGRDSNSTLRMDHIHVRHPAVSVLHIDEAKGEGPRYYHIQAAASRKAGTIFRNLRGPVTPFRIMGQRAVSVVPFFLKLFMESGIIDLVGDLSTAEQDLYKGRET